MKGPLLTILFIFSVAYTFTHSACTSPPPSVAADDTSRWTVDSNLLAKDSLVNGILGNTYETRNIDSSDYILLPLAAPLLDAEGAGEHVFASSSSYKETSEAYWNIIFYNTVTDTSHLLDTAKQFITSISINNREAYGAKAAKYNFYEIRRNDFNANGKLDYGDPRYLYCSDLDGRNLRLLSPVNADITSWEFPKKSGFMILKIRYDQNRDRRFDGRDATSWIRIDLDSAGRQTPLFDPAFEAEMKQLFKKQHTKPAS
jgi:hypothetical protein